MPNARVCLTLFSALIVTPATIAAQAKPAGAGRLWVELGLGASRQTPNCAACTQVSTTGGPSATATVGLTITPRFGVAFLARSYSEFSFDESHSAGYYVGLAQYSPEATNGLLTFDAGLGYGNQQGDNPPNGDNGAGTVIAAGVGLRLPSSSMFGFVVNADWLKTVTGSLSTAAGQLGSSYRPSLFTIGIGVSVASERKDLPPPSR